MSSPVAFVGVWVVAPSELNRVRNQLAATVQKTIEDLNARNQRENEPEDAPETLSAKATLREGFSNHCENHVPWRATVASTRRYAEIVKVPKRQSRWTWEAVRLLKQLYASYVEAVKLPRK